VAQTLDLMVPEAISKKLEPMKVTIPHGLTSFVDGQLHLWMICTTTHIGQLQFSLWMICATTHIGQLPLWMTCATTHIGQLPLWMIFAA